MKKLLFAFILFPLLAFTQDYEYVKTDGTYYFGTNFAYRIDSIIPSDSGQLLYSYRRIYTIINDYEGYVDPYTSWLGDQVLIDEEGRTKFYSWTNQPFTFYSDYEPEVEWEIFKYQNGNTIRGQFIGEAECLDIFPDFADSVKTISLQMYNSNGEPINHAYNDYDIRLSKNHGMLDALYYVAIDQFESITSSLKSLSGIRFADTIIGQDFYYKDAISSLEINSQMHFVSYFDQDDQYPHYVNRTVVGKQLSENYCNYTYLDSILYLGEVTTNTHEEKWYISALPFESMFPNDSLDKRGYMYTGGWHLGDKWDHNTYFSYHFWHGNNTIIFDQPAWYVDFWELNMGNQYDYRFIKNVGHLTVGKGNDWPGDELLYYKNSEQEWGDPINIEPYQWDGSYPVFVPGFTFYYKSEPVWGPVRDIRAIRIDSIVATENQYEKKYYSFRTAEPYLYNETFYLNPNTSWIGDYALVNDSGYTVIQNQYGKEFLINSGTEYDLGSYLFHDLGEDGYINAHSSYGSVVEFLPGISDTVRYLSFNYVGENNNYNQIENISLRWSKNFGLLDFIDFNQPGEFKAYYLIGMKSESCSFGWTDTRDEILTSLRLNDESHLEYTDSLGRKTQVKRTIVDRELDEEYISYVIDHCYQIQSDSLISLHKKDTLVFALNVLPRQSIFKEEITGYQHSLGYGYFDTLEVCTGKAFFEFYRTNALEEVDVDGKVLWRTNHIAHFENQSNFRFIENIGISSNIKYVDEERDTIVYYTTADENCGMAFDFECLSGLIETDLADFRISPNPSNGLFYITSSEQIEEIKVYNVNGQLVWQELQVENKSIDLSNQFPGIYIVELMFSDGHFQTTKLLLNP